MEMRRMSFVEMLFFVVVVCLLTIERGKAWNWPWGEEQLPQETKRNHGGKKAGIPSTAGDAGGQQRNPERRRRATFETAPEGTYRTHQPVISEGQKVLSLRASATGDGSMLQSSCWATAYHKLSTNCKEIVQNEEKRCRLSYEFTQCFLHMSGWPAPPPCPDYVPIKSCTEKMSEHIHGIYLSFFVDSAAECHHIQSEAFKQETDEMMNDLRESGDWILERVMEVDDLSHQILDDTVEQSEILQGKLAIVEGHSEKLLEQHTELEALLSTTKRTVEVLKLLRHSIH